MNIKNANIMMTLSEKAKDIIKEDDELTIVDEHEWDESNRVSISITRCDSELDNIAEAEIDNRDNRIDIHDSVRDEDPELFKINNVDVHNLTNKVSELV